MTLEDRADFMKIDLEKERKEREKAELIQTLLNKYYEEQAIKKLLEECHILRKTLGMRDSTDNYVIRLSLEMNKRDKERRIKSRLKRIAKAVNKKKKRVKI
jgi:predicted SAM-dependent methyltransferase